MVGQTVEASAAIDAIVLLCIPTEYLPLFEQLALRDHDDVALP